MKALTIRPPLCRRVGNGSRVDCQSHGDKPGPASTMEPGGLVDLSAGVRARAGVRVFLGLLASVVVPALLGCGTNGTSQDGREQGRGLDAVAVAAGDGNGCAVLEAGKVACWGRDLKAQVVPGVQGATDVSLARGLACSAVTTGRGVCWTMKNGEGKVEPPVVDAGVSLDPPGLAVGGPQGVCGVSGGEAVCRGAPGDLKNDLDLVPFPPTVVANSDGVSRLPDRFESLFCFVRAEGQVMCSDTGPDGLRPPTRARAVEGLPDGVAVSSGVATGCAIRTAGTVVCWGAGSWGLLGNGQQDLILAPELVSTPVQVSDVDGAVSISVGGDSACAAIEGGQVKCSGRVRLGRSEAVFTSHMGPRRRRRSQLTR